jgi:hypothetical protein
MGQVLLEVWITDTLILDIAKHVCIAVVNGAQFDEDRKARVLGVDLGMTVA